MTDKVYQAFKRVLNNRISSLFSIDGYSNFVFLKADGFPKTKDAYESMFKRIVNKYNKLHKNQLPHITPHILRHTFCTNMADSGMNPKALQYIMGHASVSMTLDYYAHATFDSAKSEMERLMVINGISA